MASTTFTLVITAADGKTPTSSDAVGTAIKLRNYFHSRAGKNYQGSDTLKVRTGAVAASGTVTCASVSAADTVTIGGVVFTAVAGSPTGNQFDQSLATNTLVAADLVRAVNASSTAGVTGCVTAANVAGVVTFTAATPGKIGNAITLASSNGTRLAVSGARLANGAETLTTHTL